ncbi:MAG: site-2 protease family protein [Thermoproteota archaeon]|nr:MAG: site-2 protease family protein [Candidatus Korarchaeota archaeon]RLG56203.1 MAG: site-2 protease family protein [Candidatus Korarchaeota archaeon]
MPTCSYCGQPIHGDVYYCTSCGSVFCKKCSLSPELGYHCASCGALLTKESAILKPLEPYYTRPWYPVPVRGGKLSFTGRELSDIALALAALLISAWILERGGLRTFLVVSPGIAVGFLLHELAHKFTAQHLGYQAEFRAFWMGILIMVLTSLTGFILFAAPGAVVVGAAYHWRERDLGLIASAGPLTNIVLALLFLATAPLASGLAAGILGYAAKINSWLAFFNLIPLWELDGRKIAAWSWKAWALLAAAALALLVLS